MKRADLIGKRFGKLVVTGKTDLTEDRYTVWECRCDCGGKILVNTKKLTRGTVQDCGCIPKNTARNGTIAEDLTGRRFGKLTVLERAENKNGRVSWVCRCDCGNLKTVQSNALKAGRVRSCGCLRWKYKDLTGEEFGRLTVLYPLDTRDSRGSVIWHCRCSCGNETDVSQNNLISGTCQSCGCLHKENQQKLPGRLHHIDGTCVEWIEKRKSRCDNRSGFRGIYRNKKGRYRASIGFQGQRYYLGTYDNFSDAVDARMDAEHILHDGFVHDYRIWKEKADRDPEWAGKHPFSYDVSYENKEFIVRSSIREEN